MYQQLTFTIPKIIKIDEIKQGKDIKLYEKFSTNVKSVIIAIKLILAVINPIKMLKALNFFIFVLFFYKVNYDLFLQLFN